MAVDLLTLGVGSVDGAAPADAAPKVGVTNTAKNENISVQFAAQLASTPPAQQQANHTSELSAAKKFEAIFVAQMMASILPEDSEYFGEGFAGDAWRSMMSEQLANVAVKQSDFGIASLIDQSFANKSDNSSASLGREPRSSSDLISPILENRTE